MGRLSAGYEGDASSHSWACGTTVVEAPGAWLLEPRVAETRLCAVKPNPRRLHTAADHDSSGAKEGVVSRGAGCCVDVGTSHGVSAGTSHGVSAGMSHGVSASRKPGCAEGGITSEGMGPKSQMNVTLLTMTLSYNLRRVGGSR